MNNNDDNGHGYGDAPLDAGSLVKSGRQVKAPFVLSVVADDSDWFNITIKQVLRLLPGRRIVAIADDGEKLIFIKLFIGRLAARYSHREAAGARAIEAAGVATPAFLWQGRLRSGGGFLLAFEYLAGARRLNEAFDQVQGTTERLALMQQVMPILATLHQSHVVQNDIHLDNFLIRDEIVYTVGGGDITKYRTSRRREQKSMNNLAMFFAQFHAGHDALVPAAFECYSRRREPELLPSNFLPFNKACHTLLRRVKYYRDARLRDYIKKAFRECTRISCQSSFRRVQICQRRHDTPEMRRLLANLDEAIAGAAGAAFDGDILKAGDTTTIARVEGPGGPLVIKRYNMKNLLHRVSRAFRHSRAWSSWGNAFRLEFLGIRTPAPVALVEERYGPIRGKAYFVTEFMEGATAFSLTDLTDPASAVSSIVGLLESLTEAGMIHGDLKASNILLGSAGAAIIDLDSMAYRGDKRTFDAAVRKDRARFMRNWTSVPAIGELFTARLNNKDRQ